MRLFQIQDSDRPMWVIAGNWIDALEKWREQIRKENPPEPKDENPEPDGIMLVSDEGDLLV